MDSHFLRGAPTPEHPDGNQGKRPHQVLAGLGAVALAAFLGWPGKPPHAQPATVTVTWVNATQNTDGTALTDLAGTRIQWGACGGPLNTGQVEVAAPGKTAQVSLPGPGEWCFSGTHYTADGRVSAPSPEVRKRILPRPKPPASLTVE